jgi:hypothetical protein
MLGPLYIEAFFKPKLRVPNDKRGSMVWVMIVILKLNSDSCPVKMIHSVLISGTQHYSGCHKYVPFARFSNRRKYNV